MKYQGFVMKLLALGVICGVLYHYQNIAAARAAVIAENEAAVAEVEAYNQEIRKENARRQAGADGGTAEGELVYKDGTYEGTGTGYGGDIVVSVTVESDTLTDFKVISHEGEDPAYFALAEGLVDNVLQKQSAAVDTASGATFSSKGILEALENALKEAVNE